MSESEGFTARANTEIGSETSNIRYISWSYFNFGIFFVLLMNVIHPDDDCVGTNIVIQNAEVI